jgi:hypothetical protein
VSDYGTVLTVVRRRRDTDGDLVGDGEERVLEGWAIAPASSTEQADEGRTATVTRLQCYGGPPGADLRPGDLVFLERDRRTDGNGRSLAPRWQIVGSPDLWGTPGGGWDPGAVVTLQRVSSLARRRD